MSLCKQTRIFVHFPSTGEVCEEIVNYKETISQLITRMLNSLNINNPDAFHLYAIDKKCRYFRPDESCSSLFGINCKQLILTRSELINIDLFFENRHYYVVYEKSTPAMTFLENTLHLLQSSSTKFRPPLTKEDLINYYFALYDPIADVIIHSNSTINTTFIVLKRFEYIAPGYVFDFSIIKDISPKLSNCSYENTVISNFIKQFRSYHRNEHISGIEIVEFDEKRSQFLFDSFRNKQFDKNGVSLSEQVNFLFSILSLSKQPYIPPSLREMVLEAMQLEDDRKIFDIARAIAIYMPLSTYLVLQEIFQFFGVVTIDEHSWNNVSLMLAELLFESKSDEENYTDDIFEPSEEKYKNETPDEKEEREGDIFIRFTRFLLLFFKQIFNLKDTIGRKNSIRMIKKNPRLTSKNRTKKSKKKKEIDNTEENQNNEDYGNLFDWVDLDPNSPEIDRTPKEETSINEDKNNDNNGNSINLVDSDQKNTKTSKKKKEKENSDEIQNDEDDNSNSYESNSETKKSKSSKKRKERKTQDETSNNDEENANYSFILHEEMKTKEMVTRTIYGFVNIDLENTTEFVPNDSIFDLLNSLAIKDEEEIKEQDISSELNELNYILSSLKAKFNSPVLNQPVVTPKP